MEKQVSIFIGQTIFSLVKIYHISILIGYKVFLTSEENLYCHFAHNMAAVLGKERKGIWLLCLKEEKFAQ